MSAPDLLVSVVDETIQVTVLQETIQVAIDVERTVEVALEVGVPGIQGPRGPSGSGSGSDALSFTGTWSSFFTAHDFPYLPPVLVVDAGGLPVETDYEYPDATHVAITFPAPFTGTITIG